MEASADKIADTISQQPAEHAVVVMAHNGPSGVGAAAHDICGKDWSDKAGALHHTSVLMREPFWLPDSLLCLK